MKSTGIKDTAQPNNNRFSFPKLGKEVPSPIVWMNDSTHPLAST